jgi:hypothetical protein
MGSTLRIVDPIGALTLLTLDEFVPHDHVDRHLERSRDLPFVRVLCTGRSRVRPSRR